MAGTSKGAAETSGKESIMHSVKLVWFHKRYNNWSTYLRSIQLLWLLN